MRLLERLLMLQTIDRLWVEHLTAMDEMRQGIGLQAYGQQDPLVAYKREAHDMWEQLLGNIRHTIARAIYHVNLSPDAGAAAGAGVRSGTRAGCRWASGRAHPRTCVRTAAKKPRCRQRVRTAARSGATTRATVAPARSTSDATVSRHKD